MGISVKDVSAHEFNKALADFLKSSMWSVGTDKFRHSDIPLRPSQVSQVFVIPTCFCLGLPSTRAWTGKVKVPEWADVVKLGRFNELSPYDEDWFYIRAASVARHLYIRSPCGVGALTKIYSGNKRNGTTPSHHCRGSRSVARKVLQTLESLKLVEQDANTGGRRLTSQGRRDLDRIASQIKSGGKKAAPK